MFSSESAAQFLLGLVDRSSQSCHSGLGCALGGKPSCRNFENLASFVHMPYVFDSYSSYERPAISQELDVPLGAKSLNGLT